jgi:hypothetical protein
MRCKSTICLVLLILILSIPQAYSQWEFLGLPGMSVLAVATHPQHPEWIAAGTNYYGLYVSFNNGGDWNYKIATNVPLPFVAYDPHTTDSLFAVVGASYSAGLYGSNNYGDSWHLINYLLYPRRLAFDPANPGYLYICFETGIKASQDYGLNFYDANNGLPGLNIIDIKGDAVNQFEAYAAGEAFVAHTTNFGVNWTDLGGLFGLEDYNPNRLEIDPRNPNTIFVACWAYLARSTDRGQNWEYFTAPAVNLTDVVCDPLVEGQLFVGTGYNGVYKSTDYGVTFTPLDDIGNMSICCLEIDSQGRLLAGTEDGLYGHDISIRVDDCTGNLPDKNVLITNYPNPFNASTTIAYTISDPQAVSLKIYDITGRETGILVDKFQTAGTYRVIFDGSSLVSGIYFYRLQAGDLAETGKMVLLK